MEIIGRFMVLESEESRMGNQVRKKETMFFPRYHQREVVRQLVASVRESGAGENYLIQHSAGSGKSKSIAWLSYQLFSMHNAYNERIFNAVIVMTDLLVLGDEFYNYNYH